MPRQSARAREGASVSGGEREAPHPDALTLDPDREWTDVSCEACGSAQQIHVGPDNHTAVEVTEVVTLEDGAEVPVTRMKAVPSPTLRWECGDCDTIQEVEL